MVEDTAQYSLVDILQRFPLPQRLALVEPVKHSEVLTRFLPPSEKAKVTFMLKEKVQEEYIIGEDFQKNNGIVLHVDLDLYFYVPESVNPSYVEKEELKQSRLRSVQDEDEVNINQFICKKEDKPAMRGPIEMLFRNLVLPPRSHILEQNPPSKETQSSVFEEGPQGLYGNIEITLGKSRQELFGKIGTGSPSGQTQERFLPPIPPKPHEGKEDSHNIRLMTPEETHDFASGRALSMLSK